MKKKISVRDFCYAFNIPLENGIKIKIKDDEIIVEWNI